MAAVGLFGDPDGVERLARALLGSTGRGGVTEVVRELRDQVSHIVGGLVPDEWSGDAADAFARSLNDEIVRGLLALSEAAGDLGSPLQELAADIRAANGKGEHAKAIAGAAGFEIDTYGNLSSSLLQSIEHVVAGSVDAHAMTEATETMLAARHIAESAWDAVRRALANVQVPRIGHDSLRQAEGWAFANAAPSHPPAPGSGVVRTGLLPTTPRPDEYIEGQRVAAIRLVRERCELIKKTAHDCGVPPEAIAGAILWEALENPRPSDPFDRVLEVLVRGPGPGKAHYYEPSLFELAKPYILVPLVPVVPPPLLQTSDAERAENDGKLPKASLPERHQRVTDQNGAIRYIGAILSDNADIYERRGFDISTNIGVLLTLYEEGHAEQKANDLAEERKSNPSAVPRMGADMGPWVVDHLPWVRAQLPCVD
jgi:hypothetical protein